MYRTVGTTYVFIAWDTCFGFNFDFNVALNLLKYSFLMFSFIPSWRIFPFSKTPRYLYPSSPIWPIWQRQLFWQGYQVVYKWFNLLLALRNEYPFFIRLKASVKGISDKMKSKSDIESPWNIPRLIFTLRRLVSPDINFVFQSIIVDFKSAITLGGSWPIIFKALLYHF